MLSQAESSGSQSNVIVADSYYDDVYFDDSYANSDDMDGSVSPVTKSPMRASSQSSPSIQTVKNSGAEAAVAAMLDRGQAGGAGVSPQYGIDRVIRSTL